MRIHLFLFISFLLTLGCASTKKAPNTTVAQKGNLTIKEAFIQKEIPGERDQLTESFLYFTIDNSSQNLFMDSVLFERIYLPALQDGISYKVKIGENQREDKPAKTKASYEGADPVMLYYRIEDQHYFQGLNGIKIKQPLYRP